MFRSLDSTLKRYKQTSIRFSRIVWLLLGLLLIPATWFLWQKLENEMPVITAEFPASVRPDSEHRISVSDQRSGLRRTRVLLIQQGREIVIADLAPDTPGVHELSIPFQIDTRKHRLSDGAMTLVISVRDRSWRNWFHGNNSERRLDITMDGKPPQITVLTRFHHINQGGAGLIIYRLSEACPTHGVQAGPHFFPGYSGIFDDPSIMACLFALDYRQGAGTELFVQARDHAGNTSRTGFSNHILRKTFQKDLIPITDDFLNRKMPEFQMEDSPDSPHPMLDRFLRVNRESRESDTRRLFSSVENSPPELLWGGTFLRLPNSAPRAGFADHRTYVYQGKEIDRQDHMGVDLASLQQSPVPAANGGRVVMTEDIGIYGNTVVIDHGLGLFSMYSHLSDFSVQPGQTVAKGDIIGHTGITGLAAGDHLHYAMSVRDVFVNPIEWWDESWIQNNILSKIQDVRQLIP